MEKYVFKDSKKFEADEPLKIDSVAILWVEDSDQPDHLGEYSNEPGPGAIDREALGERGPHEFRYFNPPHHAADNPEYAMQDYRRYQAYCAGEWSLEGCYAVAVVSYPCGDGARRMETLRSGGLWGIESDAGADHRTEVEIEQLEDLKKHVQVFGVSWKDEHDQAIAKLKEKLDAPGSA